MDLSTLQNAIVLFQQQHPWVTDKAGALLTQGVRELWEVVKAKLGSGAAQKIEAAPDDTSQWEVFKAKLLVALDEDEEFCEKFHALVSKSEHEMAAISQRADGDNNTQIAVDRSANVNIRTK